MSDRVPGSAPISRVARGSIAAFLIYGAGIGLTYCSQLVIARILGVDIYGMYAYVFAWMVVLAYFSTLGFDVGLLRFVPTYEAEHAWPLLEGVIQYAQRRAAAVGLSVILVGIFVVMAWGGITRASEYVSCRVRPGADFGPRTHPLLRCACI